MATFSLEDALPVKKTFSLSEAMTRSRTASDTESVGSGIGDAVLDRLSAFAGGLNKAPAVVAGMPIDTLANAVDLLKAAGGVGYHELTGNAIPDWLTPADRNDLPGTSAWLLSQARKVPGVQGNIIDTPQEQHHPGFSAAGTAAGASAVGASSIPAALGAATMGGASGALGQQAHELTGDNQVGVLASLLPYVAARGVPAAYNAAVDAISPGKATPIERASFEGGNRIGLVASPSSMNRSTLAETLAGTPQVRERASLKNEATVNAAAADYLGLPAKTSLTPAVFDNALSGALAKYDPVAKLPSVSTDNQYLSELNRIDMNYGGTRIAGANAKVSDLLDRAHVQSLTGAEAIKEIRELRFSSTKNYRSDDPATVNLAKAQRAVADAIEGTIDRNGGGPPAMMQDYRDARRQIAKLNTIQDAMNPGTGNVNIVKLARSDAPLTGSLAAAAQFARAFPKDVRPDLSSGPMISQLGQYGAIAGGAFGEPGRGLAMAGILAAKRMLGAPAALGQGSQRALLGQMTPINPMLLSQPAVQNSGILSNDYLNGQ